MVCNLGNLANVKERLWRIDGIYMVWSVDLNSQKVHVTAKDLSCMTDDGYGTWMTFRDTHDAEKMQKLYENIRNEFWTRSLFHQLPPRSGKTRAIREHLLNTTYGLNMEDKVMIPDWLGVLRTRLKEYKNIETTYSQDTDTGYVVIRTESTVGDFCIKVEKYVGIDEVFTHDHIDMFVEWIAERHEKWFEMTYDGNMVTTALMEKHGIEASIDKLYHKGELEGYRINAKRLVWFDDDALPKQYTCCVSELHERKKSLKLIDTIASLFEKEETDMKTEPNYANVAKLGKKLHEQGVDFEYDFDFIHGEAIFNVHIGDHKKSVRIGFDCTYESELMDKVFHDIMELPNGKLQHVGYVSKNSLNYVLEPKLNVSRNTMSDGWDFYRSHNDCVIQLLRDFYTGMHNLNEKENDSMNIAAQIKKVVFNAPAVIVMWKDGTKTIVKATNEEFDPEKGLAMAISKKVLGNKHEYYNVFKKYLKKYEKENK